MPEFLKDGQLAADTVMEGFDPGNLADDALLAAHRYFTHIECSLPPAGAVADEVARRGLVVTE